MNILETSNTSDAIDNTTVGVSRLPDIVLFKLVYMQWRYRSFKNRPDDQMSVLRIISIEF